MRRAFVGLACVAVLVFAGTSTALAKGPHHGGHGGHGRGPGGHGNWNHRGGYHQAYRLPPPRVFRPPVCGPVYPVYPAPVVTAYPAYPRLGFGLGGSNFSFWYQQ